MKMCKVYFVKLRRIYSSCPVIDNTVCTEPWTHLLEAECANAREISVSNVPVVNICHAYYFSGFINSHLTAGH